MIYDDTCNIYIIYKHCTSLMYVCTYPSIHPSVRPSVHPSIHESFIHPSIQSTYSCIHVCIIHTMHLEDIMRIINCCGTTSILYNHAIHLPFQGLMAPLVHIDDLLLKGPVDHICSNRMRSLLAVHQHESLTLCQVWRVWSGLSWFNMVDPYSICFW